MDEIIHIPSVRKHKQHPLNEPRPLNKTSPCHHILAIYRTILLTILLLVICYCVYLYLFGGPACLTLFAEAECRPATITPTQINTINIDRIKRKQQKEVAKGGSTNKSTRRRGGLNLTTAAQAAYPYHNEWERIIENFNENEKQQWTLELDKCRSTSTSLCHPCCVTALQSVFASSPPTWSDGDSVDVDGADEHATAVCFTACVPTFIMIHQQVIQQYYPTNTLNAGETNYYQEMMAKESCDDFSDTCPSSPPLPSVAPAELSALQLAQLNHQHLFLIPDSPEQTARAGSASLMLQPSHSINLANYLSPHPCGSPAAVLRGVAQGRWHADLSWFQGGPVTQLEHTMHTQQKHTDIDNNMQANANISTSHSPTPSSSLLPSCSLPVCPFLISIPPSTPVNLTAPSPTPSDVPTNSMLPSSFPPQPIEQANFVTTCPLPHYHPAVICRILSRFSLLRLIGDSFFRHVWVGLIGLAADNVPDRAHFSAGFYASTGACSGDHAYSEMDCRLMGGNFIIEQNAIPFCPQLAKTPFKINKLPFLERYFHYSGSFDLPKIFRTEKIHAEQSERLLSTIYLHGSGFHDAVGEEHAMENVASFFNGSMTGMWDSAVELQSHALSIHMDIHQFQDENMERYIERKYFEKQKGEFVNNLNAHIRKTMDEVDRNMAAKHGSARFSSNNVWRVHPIHLMHFIRWRESLQQLHRFLREKNEQAHIDTALLPIIAKAYASLSRTFAADSLLNRLTTLFPALPSSAIEFDSQLNCFHFSPDFSFSSLSIASSSHPEFWLFPFSQLEAGACLQIRFEQYMRHWSEVSGAGSTNSEWSWFEPDLLLQPLCRCAQSREWVNPAAHLNITALTKHVPLSWSWDGVHYTRNLNHMKLYVLFNYLHAVVQEHDTLLIVKQHLLRELYRASRVHQRIEASLQLQAKQNQN